MVIVDKKFNEMSIDSMVQDVDFGYILHVTSRPRTTLFGTEIGLVTDSGQRFYDNPLHYRPFV